jgi:RNA polymerase sigma factor (sigma-70 family)
MQAPHPDQRFITALCQGEETAIRTIYREHKPGIIHWVKQNKGQESDALDLMQDALLAIFEKSCDPQFTLYAPFGALLFTIVKNKWLKKLGKKSANMEVRTATPEEYDTSDAQNDVLTLAIQAETEQSRQSALSRAFSELSPLCQQLLEAQAAGVAVEQSVIALGFSNANALYQRKKKCVDRWKTLFQQYYH